jgi:hypothetical protein
MNLSNRSIFLRLTVSLAAWGLGSALGIGADAIASSVFGRGVTVHESIGILFVTGLVIGLTALRKP